MKLPDGLTWKDLFYSFLISLGANILAAIIFYYIKK